LAFGVKKRNSLGIWEDYSEGLPSYDGFIDVASIDLGPDNNLWATVVPLVPSNDGGVFKTIDPVSDVEETSTDIPNTFNLKQNYPNPFNPSTIIKYSVPENGFVKLSVYNLVGEEVNVLVNETVNAGFYEVTFNAANLPSGTYFYRIQAGNYIETKKMVLMK